MQAEKCAPSPHQNTRRPFKRHHRSSPTSVLINSCLSKRISINCSSCCQLNGSQWQQVLRSLRNPSSSSAYVFHHVSSQICPSRETPQEASRDRNSPLLRRYVKVPVVTLWSFMSQNHLWFLLHGEAAPITYRCVFQILSPVYFNYETKINIIRNKNNIKESLFCIWNFNFLSAAQPKRQGGQKREKAVCPLYPGYTASSETISLSPQILCFCRLSSAPWLLIPQAWHPQS